MRLSTTSVIVLLLTTSALFSQKKDSLKRFSHLHIVSGMVEVFDSSIYMMRVIDSVYCPKNIYQCNDYLDSIFHTDVKKYIKTITEDDFIEAYLYIVSNRWNGYFSCTLDYYNSTFNLTDPYEIQEMILRFYYRYLKGIDLNIDFEIKKSKKHERKEEHYFKKVSKDFERKRKRIKKNQDYNVDVSRKIIPINDTTNIVKVSFPAEKIPGMTTYFDLIPCGCKIKVIKSEDSRVSFINNTLKFLWYIILTSNKIELEYKIFCNLDVKKLEQMYGQLSFFKNEYSISIIVKNIDK